MRRYAKSSDRSVQRELFAIICGSTKQRPCLRFVEDDHCYHDYVISSIANEHSHHCFTQSFLLIDSQHMCY